MTSSSTTIQPNPNCSFPTIKTRFLLLSDTHSHPPHPPSTTSHAYRLPLPKSDVLIHAGDLSLSGEIDEYRRTFELIRDADAGVKIVIPGNHDLSLDPKYVARKYVAMQARERDSWVAEARELWIGEEARRAGILFLGGEGEGEGVRSVEVGNGGWMRIYTSPYTPEFCNMAFPYARHHDRFNPPSLSPSNNPDFNPPNPCPSWPEIDIMITHGPPMHHMDGVDGRGGGTMPVGCINQLHALRRARPRLSVFGHIHEGWGAEWVDWGEGKAVEEDRSGRVESELQPKEGGKVTRIEVDNQDPEVLERGYAYVDASRDGGREVRWGQESLLVNAAILDRGYRAVNAPWVVDLDLPASGTDAISTNFPSERL